MSDILEKFTLSEDSLVIGKINIDTNAGLTKKYNVRGVPQFLLLKNGDEIRRHVGPMTREELKSFVIKKLPPYFHVIVFSGISSN